MCDIICAGHICLDITPVLPSKFARADKVFQPGKLLETDELVLSTGGSVANTGIALTKLDVLSYMDRIPLCAHYEIDGVQTDDFPFPILLDRAKPVMEYMPGWQCDISGARRWEDLPEAARSYVEYVEKAIGCPIGYVSVGAERESLILR